MSAPILEARGLRKTFGDFVAVNDVDFHVERGEIFGYLGANGAGKSTTIRMLCGLLEPSGGRATVVGHDVGRHPQRVKASIGYMSQRFSLYLDLPAEDNLRFFSGIYGFMGGARRRAIESVCERAGLDRATRRSVTGDLPGGVRQRLALACALIHSPRLVFLDEPTAGVAPASRRDFWRLIRGLADAGTTVFVTTHYMDEAEYCGRIGLMVDGELVAVDTPAALKAQWVPGEVVAFEGVGLRDGYHAVRELPEVIAATPFGARMHVRFREGQVDPNAVRRALAGVGAVVERTEPVEASLEDVFLEVVGGAEKEAA
ncbi:MAG: ATP-binding cassette domain-containing protein [Sandaracinaceae bacterium]